MTPIQSPIRDQAQALAERLSPLLKEQISINLDGSKLWIEDIHGSSYVAWAEDDEDLWTETATVYPELRQVGGCFDYLPTEQQLQQFINACDHIS